MRENQPLLDQQWRAHKEVFAVASQYQRIRELYRYLIGLDAKGEIPDQNGEIDDMRTPDQFRRFCIEYRNIQDGSNNISLPNLILAPINKQSAPITSPIIFDGESEGVYVEKRFGQNRSFDLTSDRDYHKFQDWWRSHVTPHLEEHTELAPRIVAREDTLDRLKELTH